jgi:hypothetical protein
MVATVSSARDLVADNGATANHLTNKEEAVDSATCSNKGRDFRECDLLPGTVLQGGEEVGVATLGFSELSGVGEGDFAVLGNKATKFDGNLSVVDQGLGDGYF